MSYKTLPESISDEELISRLLDLVIQSQQHEAELVAHIGEVDERKLYAAQGSPSMFSYCTKVLHLSEDVAYRRIGVARASRKYPILLEMLANGRLHVTGISILLPHLNEENCESLLKRAIHLSKRKIEELIAEVAPRPDVSTTCRKLPEPRTKEQPAPAPQLDSKRPPSEVASGIDPTPAEVATPAPAPVRRPVIEPLSPGRYKVEFTASGEFRDKLDRLRALKRSSIPDGDIAAVLELAVTETLERLEAKRFGKTRAPRETEKLSKRPIRRLRRALSPQRSSVPLWNVMVTNAPSYRRKAAAAPLAMISSSTTTTPLAEVATTLWRTSA